MEKEQKQVINPDNQNKNQVEIPEGFRWNDKEVLKIMSISIGEGSDPTIYKAILEDGSIADIPADQLK